jgi:predicted DNA-binding transcriptional regulator AlpA
LEPRIRIKQRQLHKFRRMVDLQKDTALAQKMGMSRQTVYRAIKQEKGLSEHFVVRLLSAFPALEFDDLFEVTVEDDPGELAS